MIARDLFDANSTSYGMGWRVSLIKVRVGEVVDCRFYARSSPALGLHFLGRAIPCSGDECPACFAGLTPRPTFYLPCTDAADQRHFGIVEIGATTWSHLHELTKELPIQPSWLTARFIRRSPNKPIIVSKLSIAENQSGSIKSQHAGAMIARLFELPMPDSDNLVDWHNKIRGPLNAKLLAALRKL